MPLETTSGGVPVVAGNTVIYGGIIHRKVGHITPLETIDALAGALMNIAESIVKVVEMDKNAQHTADTGLSLHYEADRNSRLLTKIWRGETFC
jgi:hypothetical protein